MELRNGTSILVIVIYHGRDATVGVHKDFLRSEFGIALYLVQNTNEL